MAFIRQIIERKISSLTRAWVTFGDFKFSPMSGKIEVAALKISPERFVPPVLAIDRLEANVSVKRALKGEIAVRSMTIERPVLILSMHADGAMNFARKSANAAEPSDQKESASAWEFNAEKITLTNGRVEFRDGTRNNYSLSMEGINATLTPEGQDISIALSADSVGRRDRPVELGALHCVGKLTGGGFANLGGSALSARVSIADSIVLQVACSLLAKRSFDIEIAAALKLATLVALVPLSPAQRWAFTSEGDAQVQGKLTLDVQKSIRVSNVELKIGEFNLSRTFGSHGA